MFWGTATEARAVIYARLDELELPPLSAGQRMGEIHGPFADQVHTLPARYDFKLPARSATAECLIPDPCFWTPRVPLFYQARLTIPQREQDCCEFQQMIGIRRLGIVGTDFRWDGRRWVVRGVEVEPRTDLPLTDFRDTGTAAFVLNPADDFCEAASRKGVVIIARLEPSDELESTVARLARWPAVAMVALSESNPNTNARLRRLAPNLLFARIVRGDVLPEMVGACDVLIVDASNEMTSMDSLLSHGKPTVIWKPAARPVDWRQARAECDALQARLTAAGILSGYLS
jgi:hypothetical protein